MNRFKEQIDAELRSLALTPELLRRTLARIERREGGNMRKRSKLSVALVAALIALLVLTGVGFATGAIQSLFSRMSGLYMAPDEFNHEKLDELSQTASPSPTRPTSDEPSFTLLQSYYDGTQALVGYQISSVYGPVEFGFGPEHPRWNEIQIQQNEPRRFADGFDPNSFDLPPPRCYMSGEQFAEYERRLEQDGRVGWTMHSAWISDGKYVLGSGDDFYPTQDEYFGTSPFQVQFVNGFTDLPKKSRNLDALPLSLTLKTYLRYVYQDETGVYIRDEDLDLKPIELTLPRNSDDIKTYKAERKTDAYTASATLSITPVNLNVSIDFSAPDGSPLPEETEWSIVPDHYLLLVNGKPIDLSIGSNNSGFGGSISLMEVQGDVKQVRLVARRYTEQEESIATQGEDIEFSLA